MSLGRLLFSNSRCLLQHNFTSIIAESSQRSITRTAIRHGSGAYQADGKTVVTPLSMEIEKYLIVESYNEKGFHLSNKSFAVGPIILFPSIIFQWKIKTIDDIDADSLRLFQLLHPKLDLLLIGIGEPGYRSAQALMKLRQSIAAIGVNAELMATRDAIATYNFMLADFRVVAGAFLPTTCTTEQKLLRYQK